VVQKATPFSLNAQHLKRLYQFAGFLLIKNESNWLPYLLSCLFIYLFIFRSVSASLTQAF